MRYLRRNGFWGQVSRGSPIQKYKFYNHNLYFFIVFFSAFQIDQEAVDVLSNFDSTKREQLVHVELHISSLSLAFSNVYSWLASSLSSPSNKNQTHGWLYIKSWQRYMHLNLLSAALNFYFFVIFKHFPSIFHIYQLEFRSPVWNRHRKLIIDMSFQPFSKGSKARTAWEDDLFCF